MTENQDKDQNDLPQLLPKDLFLKQAEDLLKPLISSIEQMKAEATNASYSFDANAQEVIISIQNTKQDINNVIELINIPLKDLEKTSDALKSTAKILALLPNKIDDRLAKLPHNFSQVLSDSIPDIAKKLNSTLEQSVEQVMRQLDESRKSTSINTEKSTTELVTIFKTEIGKLSEQFKQDILLYKREVGQLIEVSSKERMRKFLLILAIAGSFSAIVSGVTSWVINKHFPRSVEITGNQHLVVKDSQVLVHGSDTYRLEKQKKKEN